MYFYAIKMNSRFGKAKTYIVDIRVGKSYFILFHPIPLYTCIINAYLSSRIYTVVKKNSILYSNYLSHALQRRPGVKLGQRASWGHQGCTEKWPPELDHKQTLPIPLVNKKWMNKELNNLHTCNVNNVQFYYLIFTCNSDWPSFSRYHVLNRPINFSTLLSLATCQRSLAYQSHNDAVKII